MILLMQLKEKVLMARKRYLYVVLFAVKYQYSSTARERLFLKKRYVMTCTVRIVMQLLAAFLTCHDSEQKFAKNRA